MPNNTKQNKTKQTEKQNKTTTMKTTNYKQQLPELECHPLAWKCRPFKYTANMTVFEPVF